NIERQGFLDMVIRVKRNLDNYENNMSEIFDDFNSINNYDNDYGFQESLIRSQNNEIQNINNNTYNKISINDSFVDRRNKADNNVNYNREPDYANYQDNNYEDYFDNDYFEAEPDILSDNMLINKSKFESINNYNSKSKKSGILGFIKGSSANEKNVASYILMVLIVVAVCSVIGGVFAHLSSKNNKDTDDYSQYKNTVVDSGTSDEPNDNKEKDAMDNETSLDSVSLVIDGNDNIDNSRQTGTNTTNADNKTTKTNNNTESNNSADTTSVLDDTIASTEQTSEPDINNEELSDNTKNDITENETSSILQEADNSAQNNKPEIVCTFSQGGSWKSGDYSCFQYEVYITNNTQEPIENWKGVLSLSNGAKVSSMWNASYKSDSTKGTLLVTPDDWNSNIDVNNQRSFGLIVQTKSPETFSISLSVE
ncbi:MAG: cellulose-binding domain-containing protein, partial [Lachnospiraceae bacterium]|nr:cellulose-binding domain-containing protein [Lachnospiraceae bacterium]